MSDKPATVLVCVMDMSHNQVESGGDTNFNQNCNFNVNGTQSSVAKDTNPGGGFPFGISSSMTYLEIWEQTKLILATHAVLILIVLAVFIIIMFVLWNYA